MAIIEPLTMDLVERVLKDIGYTYRIDEDGDVTLGIGRRRGKDLDFLIPRKPIEDQILALKCYCWNRYDASERNAALEFCNKHNLQFRMPKAFVIERQNDGTYFIILDHHVFCEHGISFELVHEAMMRFFIWSEEFWDEADKALA